MAFGAKLPILHQIDAVFAENCTNFVQNPNAAPIQSEAEIVRPTPKKEEAPQLVLPLAVTSVIRIHALCPYGVGRSAWSNLLP